MTERRLKVLICAYACSPYQGSEPGVGWGFVSELSRRHDLWVLVEEEKFRADIERYLADNPEFGQRAHFYFIRKQRNRTLRKLWPPSYYWYYRRWHQDALLLARKIHSEVGFDLAHQLTMVGFREPGYLWQLSVPFVWGPVGGMGLFPWRFLSEVGWYGALYYLGYNLYNLAQMRCMQRPKRAARAAGCGLITATPENDQGARKHWGCSSTVISEVGLPMSSVAGIRRRLPGEPLHIVWVGQHKPGKALNLGLEALATLPESVRWELHVLGQGRQTAKWMQEAKQLGIAERCFFHGWLDRQEALSVMAAAHVMLITSLRDLTSTVTVEALALGLPSVCLDHCGFAHAIDDTCGIKIPVTRPLEVKMGLASAIARLDADDILRQELARGAIQRSIDFLWKNKGEALSRVYRNRISEWSVPG